LELLRHAREWMFRERPYLPALLLDHLGGAGALTGTPEAEPWWWSWYFEPSDGNLLAEQPPARPELGDLRKLREADESREIDWTQVPAAGDVEEVLEGRSLA